MCGKQDHIRNGKEIYAMEVETERQGDTLIAKTDGRVDGANAREFQTALDAAIDDNECAVVLDMERLSYISSAGLRVILLTARNLRSVRFPNRYGRSSRSAVSTRSSPFTLLGVMPWQHSTTDQLWACHRRPRQGYPSVSKRLRRKLANARDNQA